MPISWSDLSQLIGTSLITGAVLLVAARVLLPKSERHRLTLPFVLLLLHIVLGTVGFLLPEELSAAKQFLHLSAIFLVLLSIGRSGFLIVIHSVLSRRLAHPLPKIFRDIIQATIYGIALLFTLRAADVDPGSLLTTSALLTAVIGLSLQDTLGNLFAGLAIQAQRPFEVGDWIQYDDREDNVGMVVEINWRAVRVRTLQHIEVTVPNNLLARAPIRNFTRPQLEARQEVTVHGTYQLPPRQIISLLTAAIRDVPGVLTAPPPSAVPREFDGRGVKYEVRYFITDFQRRNFIEGHVRERIWYALHRAEMGIPFPHVDLQMNEHGEEQDQRERELVQARASYLRRVDFINGLPKDAIDTLARLSETRLYDADEAVIRQGDEDEEFFIVQRGRVRIEVKGSDGRVVPVAHLGEGHFFGEMSLMTGERRRATVRTVDECELLVVGKHAFHKVFDDRPELMRKISEVLDHREAELHKIVRKSQAPPPEDRPAELIDRIRDFFSL